MAVNKVIYGNTVLTDLTNDAVTAEDVLEGVKFHLPSGVQATGTMQAGTKWDESYHIIPIVTARASTGGTATGSGVYELGDTVTLTATAGSGYYFVNWTKNGTQVSTNTTYTFVKANYDDETYQANFLAYVVVPIPTLSGSFVYNKGSHTVTVVGLDTAHATQRSDSVVTATNAGTYTVYWTLNDPAHSTWSDGTTGVKQATWSIAKLTNPLSASSSDSSWSYNAGTHTGSLSWGTGTGGKVVTITNAGDGTLNTPTTTNTQFSPTLSNNSMTITHSSATGATGTVTITSNATSNTEAGTIKVDCSSSTPSCVTSDTLVTLADGTKKPVSEIKYTDQLLTYRLETGEFEAQYPSKIYNDGFATFNVLCLTFDNGNTVKMMTNHGFLNCTKRTFSNITLYNYEEFIGDEFMTEDGTRTKLVSAEIRQQDTEAWAILTKYSENFITEGIVSMTGDRAEVFEIGEDMKYDANKMNADIEQYGLLKYEDYADKISEADFIETNCAYYGVPLGKGIIDDAFIEYMIPIVTTAHVVPKD